METNKNKTIARAIQLINECVQHGVLCQKNNCIAVFFQYDDDDKADWIWMPKLQAARDIVKNNAFEVLEKGLKKARATKVVESCVLNGIFHKNDDESIGHCYVPNGHKIQWENADAAADDIAEQDAWAVDNYAYNIKSIEYLEMLVETYLNTKAHCPSLHYVIFGPFDYNIVVSDGPNSHNIYYFNADSNAGGQIVQCPFDDEMARRILAGEDWIEVVADRTQYLSNINTLYFFDTVADIMQSYFDSSYIGNFANNDDVKALMKYIV